jgi:hypothetical protein
MRPSTHYVKAVKPSGAEQVGHRPRTAG